MTIFDEEFLRYLASLGAGGIIAGFMFMYYRRDVKFYTDLWRGQSDALMNIVIENTKSTVENTEVLKSLHRRLDREYRGK